MNCASCKYYDMANLDRPCKKCDLKYSQWYPNDGIAQLIEEAERKAFRAGMNYGRPKECGTSKYHANSAFNFWKEAAK